MNPLAKIGFESLFDAILNVPKSYTNTYLVKNLNKESKNSGAFRVKILSRSFFNKFLKIKALMMDFDCDLEMNIFNPQSYHGKIFFESREMIIFGSVEFKNNDLYGGWYINQPKVITTTNEIIMNFSNTKHRKSTLNKILRDEISLEALLDLGLAEDVASDIWTIFHPESTLDSNGDSDFLKSFQENGGPFGKYLEALKFVEIFNYMKILKGKKKLFPSTCNLEGDYSRFISLLPFSLTNGQKNCIQRLSTSLNSKIATRCVVVGDVGCGKTIVLLSCVMMAYPKKSILLVPTTILANQIYEEALKFLPSYVRVGIAIKDNEIIPCDFLIGTHALLYRDLDGFDLFMTDEQHRFGTNQRLKIEYMLSMDGKKPHSIQFSATPIPRTMALIESNLVDFCFIKDLPYEKNISTKIITKDDFKDLLNHIREVISQNKQVAIIYPLVESSSKINYQSIKEGLPFWERNFNNVYSTYGKDKNKENIISDFKNKGSILIATTLFEVGMSLPRLSSIVIVGPERLGFATLHQLRGRVSRNGDKGYCFLYTNTPTSPRLNDFIKTNNGFEIAEIDLKYRQSGDILSGVRQSGEQFRYFDIEDEDIARRAKDSI